MKIIAFYLPQYHQIPENDEWWGEGFTEWVNTKKAEPLYPGHYQPKTPYKQNYYNLLDPEVMVKQMELAQKYGVYGFCFYHYWFGGKKLLEKPVEMILDNERAKLPFCLSWANEPWTRTWDGDMGSKQVIMPQEYGDEADWKIHFDYLLPFFKHENYIKVNNKPLFLIYRIKNIPKCREMISLWNELARDAGFDGIYVAQMNTGFGYHKNAQFIDAVVDFEPTRTLTLTFESCSKRWAVKRRKFMKSKILSKIYLDRFKYDDICNEMIQPSRVVSKQRYYGMFMGFDNSPRRGKKGYIIDGNTPQRFEHYLSVQLKKSKEEQKEFLFLNAWNEWGEGAYLEPDEKYGYAYLHAVRRALSQTTKE